MNARINIYKNLFSVEDRVALVTGGGTGIEKNYCRGVS